MPPLRLVLGAVCVGLSHGCASGALVRTTPDPGTRPFSWAISAGRSLGAETERCRSDKPTPCILERSTPNRPVYTVLQVAMFPRGQRVRFTGAALINYFLDQNAASQMVINTEVSPAGSRTPTHASLSGRVTDVPGTYEGQIEVSVTPEGRSPDPANAVSVIIPVTVR